MTYIWLVLLHLDSSLTVILFFCQDCDGGELLGAKIASGLSDFEGVIGKSVIQSRITQTEKAFNAAGVGCNPPSFNPS